MGKQMSSGWIKGNIRKMMASSDPITRQVGKELYNTMYRNMSSVNGKYSEMLFRLNKDGYLTIRNL